MYIENQNITSEHSVKLVGIDKDNQLNFDNHISTLYKKQVLSQILLDDLENILVYLKIRL